MLKPSCFCLQPSGKFIYAKFAFGLLGSLSLSVSHSLSLSYIPRHHDKIPRQNGMAGDMEFANQHLGLIKRLQCTNSAKNRQYIYIKHIVHIMKSLKWESLCSLAAFLNISLMYLFNMSTYMFICFNLYMYQSYTIYLCAYPLSIYHLSSTYISLSSYLSIILFFFSPSLPYYPSVPYCKCCLCVCLFVCYVVCVEIEYGLYLYI